MTSMRAVGAAMILAAAGCTTVSTGRELLNTERSLPQCGLPSFVVTASPLEYPKVLLDVTSERECNVEITDNYVTHSEMHVDNTAMTIVALGVGALVGVGAGIGLSQGQPAVSPLPTATTTGAYRTSYQGDAVFIMPFVGALAGLGTYYILGKGQTPIQTLPDLKEAETRVEPRSEHTAIVDGSLTLADGTAVGELRGGQAIVDLKLAQRGYRDGLYLDGRPLEWSMRLGSWKPVFPPACQRTQDAAAADSGIEKAPLGAMARAARDAAACAREGWGFAAKVERWLDRVCQKRFDGPCDSATK
jgi:hypothetical protein